MLSNQRQTTHKCVYLVRSSHFQSQEEDGCHTIRSAIAELCSCMFYRTNLLPIKVLHCKNRELCAFCVCNLDLDLMTFIYELDPCPLKMCPQTKNELSVSRLIESYRTDIQTDAAANITMLFCGW